MQNINRQIWTNTKPRTFFSLKGTFKNMLMTRTKQNMKPKPVWGKLKAEPVMCRSKPYRIKKSWSENKRGELR